MPVMLERRDIDITLLSNIRQAWSSPSACIKSNWCRIPSAIIIFIGLLILFTFFCCCAQCLSCCCCRPRKSPRGFGGTESGRRALLPHSTSYGHSDLPAMPSYKMDSLKVPQYAVIGNDGSVTTEDQEKRMHDDFSPPPSPDKEPSAPDLYAAPQTNIFANANASFHDSLLNQSSFDTAYQSPSAAARNYPPSYESRSSPPPSARHDEHEPFMPTQANRNYRAPLVQPRTNHNTSRGAFNEGGPFPIIGQRGHAPSSNNNRPAGPRLPSPPRFQSPVRGNFSNAPPVDDWQTRPESPTTPYPATSPNKNSTRY